MAVPKKRTSKSKRNMRHSHSALKPINLTYDKNGSLSLRHHASIGGLYNDIVTKSIKEEATKKGDA